MLSERPFPGREFIRGMNRQLFIGNPCFSGAQTVGELFRLPFCFATKR